MMLLLTGWGRPTNSRLTYRWVLMSKWLWVFELIGICICCDWA